MFAAGCDWYQDPDNATCARTATLGAPTEVAALRAQVERYDRLLIDNDRLHAADGDRPELLWQETHRRLVAARRRTHEQLQGLARPFTSRPGHP